MHVLKMSLDCNTIGLSRIIAQIHFIQKSGNRTLQIIEGQRPTVKN
jgi:hypothetical protein